MKIVIDIDDEQVLFDIKNRGLEAESETDKVIINALYNGTPLPEHHGRLIDAYAFEQYCFNKNFDKRLSDEGLSIISLFLTFQPTIIEGSDSE